MTSLDSLLASTSRTFALCIPMLPRPLAGEVTVAYLLLRVADTFEDAAEWSRERRLRTLDEFAALLTAPTAHAARRLAATVAAPWPTDHPGYRELLRELPQVIGALLAIPAPRRRIVRRHVLRSVAGMRRGVERCDDGLVVRDLAELREYCYLVAGIVGEMMTDLFCATLQLGPAEAVLRANARAFGEGLQLVNILKDAAEDAAAGRHFLPPDVPLAELFALARRDLVAAETYVVALAEGGAPRALVAATSLPVRLAHLALARVESSGPGAKVSRDEVRAVVTSLLAEGAAP